MKFTRTALNSEVTVVFVTVQIVPAAHKTLVGVSDVVVPDVETKR